MDAPPHEADGASEPNAPAKSGRMLVTFLRSNVTAEWDPTAHSLLDFAEHCGLSPPFCCRGGVCGTCLSAIKRGSVAYFETPVAELAEGEILLCCSRPAESVEIDI